MSKRRPLFTITYPHAEDEAATCVAVVCDDGSSWLMTETGEWMESEPLPGSEADDS